MRWIIAAALALFFAPSAAQAWGAGGHYTVCEIGYLNLTPTAKAEVDRLIALGGRFASFTESCTYPDDGRQRPPEHFANYARDVVRVRDPGCPGGSDCVLSAIANDLAILRSATATDAEKANTLLFIGHWFGDIHQPLHISFADDRGGNSIKQSGPCSYSLHSVWDGCILERRIFSPGASKIAQARAAAAMLNESISGNQRRKWARSEPWQWAAESYGFARQPRTGYCIRKPGACWYSSDLETFAGGDQRTVKVDNAYLDWAKPIVEGRLKRGGIRLAYALNKSFDPAFEAPQP